MANWFHRNPLRATATVNFDMKMVASDGQAIRLCSELRQARKRLLEIISDANHDLGTMETAATNYLSLLQGFLIALDERGGESKLRYSTRFRWTHSMLGPTPEAQHDAIFELVSMGHNVALWYMKHAAKIAGKDDINMDEAKQVHKCLRKAAGLLQQLQEKYVGQLLEKPQEGSDLDPRVLSCYLHQCTAEAQEVTIARATEMKHNPGLISALAHETAKMFTTAADALVALNPSQFKKWRLYLQLKSVFYLSYAYCYAGESLLTEDKCGEAIRALNESEKCFADAGKLCKDYATQKGPGTTAKLDWHPFFRKLGSNVKRTLEKLKRENGFIYHQSVPYDPPQLELKATYGLVRPEDFQMPPISPLWTPDTYKAFDLSRNFGQDTSTQSKAALKAEGDLSPVKEAEVKQSSKEPKTSSGCNIS